VAVQRPSGVSALGILAICLGIMGVFSGAIQIAGLFLPIGRPQTHSGGNAKMAEVTAEFQKRFENVTKENKKTSLIVFPLLLTVSALLAAGGIAALRLKALAFVKVAFAASLLADTLGAVYGSMIQMKLMEVMKWYSQEISKASNMPGMDMVMSASSWIGVVFGVAWMIAKGAFYIIGLVYFSKPKTKEAFEGGAAPASPS
jgi:hypothetical protein